MVGLVFQVISDERLSQHRYGLGQPVSSVCPAAKFLLYLANQIDGRSRAADRDVVETRQIIFAERGVVDYRIRHRRHHREVGHPLALNQFEHFGWIEFLDDDVAGAHARQRMRSAPAVDVK